MNGKRRGGKEIREPMLPIVLPRRRCSGVDGTSTPQMLIGHQLLICCLPHFCLIVVIDKVRLIYSEREKYGVTSEDG